MDFVFSNATSPAIGGKSSFTTSSPINLQQQSQIITKSPNSIFSTFQQQQQQQSTLNNENNNQATLLCNLHLENQFTSPIPSTSFSINNLLSTNEINDKNNQKELFENNNWNNSVIAQSNKAIENDNNEKQKQKIIEQCLQERLSTAQKSEQNISTNKIEKVSNIDNIASFLSDKNFMASEKDAIVSNLTKMINKIFTVKSPLELLDNTPKSVNNAQIGDLKMIMSQNDEINLQQKQSNEILVNNNNNLFTETNLAQNNLLGTAAIPLPIDQYILMSRHSSLFIKI